MKYTSPLFLLLLITCVIPVTACAQNTGHAGPGVYDLMVSPHSLSVGTPHFSHRSACGTDFLHLPVSGGLPVCTTSNTDLEPTDCEVSVVGTRVVDSVSGGATATVWLYTLAAQRCDGFMTPRILPDNSYLGFCNYSNTDLQKALIVGKEYDAGQDGYGSAMHIDSLEVDTSGPAFNPATSDSPCGFAFCHSHHPTVVWPGGVTQCYDLSPADALSQTMSGNCGTLQTLRAE